MDNARRPAEFEFQVSAVAWLARIRCVLHHTTIGEGEEQEKAPKTSECQFNRVHEEMTEEMTVRKVGRFIF